MSSPAQQPRRPPQALDEMLVAHAKYRQNPADGHPADLTGQDLHGLDLLGYTLDGAVLKKVDFRGASLTGTTLVGADVSGADFRDSSITPSQAITTTGWLLAHWSPSVLTEIGLPTDHNERVGDKNFRGYVLQGFCLNDLDLSGAILAEANLDRADFTGTNLERAQLQDASLRNADLTSTQGLSARQLRGSDLTLAKLPPDIADSLKLQPGVEEATRTSHKVFLTMLAACLYCWLTILSTTDAGLLVGSSTLALPIVQTPMPVVAFFGAAPVLLLIVYLYLHFSLQGLWDALATLPAFFPDGRPLNERTLPWILSPIVRLHFKLLKPHSTGMARFQVRAASPLFWWAAPVTLIAFFLRFIVRHNSWVTTLQIVVAVLSVGLAVRLRRAAKDTLRSGPLSPLPWRKALFAGWVWTALLSGLAAGTLMTLFALGCFYGEPFLQEGTLHAAFTGNPTFGQIAFWTRRTTAPRLLSFIGWHAFGDLREIDLSRRPDDWDGKDLGRVKGAHLQSVDLRAAECFRLFGPNTDFRLGNLKRASFQFADLRGADFSESHLEQADLSFADLRYARFGGAHMEGTNLLGANIAGAWLGAKGLEVNQIPFAANWFLAHLSQEAPPQLNIGPYSQDAQYCDSDVCDHEIRLNAKDFSHLDFSALPQSQLEFDHPDFSGANLQHCNLAGINLEGADLSRADLRHANVNGTKLGGAILVGADLRGVDLTKTYGLTRLQIESALLDEKTALPPALVAQKPFTPKK